MRTGSFQGTILSSVSNKRKGSNSNSRRISQVHILAKPQLDTDFNPDERNNSNPSLEDEINSNLYHHHHSVLNSNFEEVRQTEYQGSSDDLYPHFRIFLIFGKFIGLIPWTGLFQEDVNELEFKKASFPAVISITIWLLLAMNSAVSLISMSHIHIETSADYARTPSVFIFYTTGLFIFVYFFRKSEELIEILQQWSRMKIHFTKPDLRLGFHVNLLAGIVLTSTILENIVGHLKVFPLTSLEKKIDSGKNEGNEMSVLERIHNDSHSNWAALVPYNPVLAVILLLCNKFAIYAVNFLDITLAIFARAIYFKFKMLYEEADADMFGGNLNTSSSYDVDKWRQICLDHTALYKMLLQIGHLLSMPIFISYAVNIYVVCLQLHLGLTPTGNHNTISSVYSIWSFLHVIARVYMVSLTSARINDWAHQVSDLFKRCPNEAYTMEVERAERFVTCNTIGFTGLGCFTITKPFILQIVSVVFTFEIVLLQANQTPFTSQGQESVLNSSNSHLNVTAHCKL